MIRRINALQNLYRFLFHPPTNPASFASSDYGVPGSPVWDEVDDISIDEVAVNGHGYTWSEVREMWGKAVALRLAVLCIEKAEAYDWYV